MRLDFETTTSATRFVENDLLTNESSEVICQWQQQLKKGIAAAQSGDRDAARVILTRVVEIEPGCEDGWLWLASISDYPEELLAFLHNVLEINPANQRAREWIASTRSHLAKTFVQRAIESFEQGQRETAGRQLDQSLAHDRDCEMAWLWKAHLSADLALKEEYLNRVLKINPANEEALTIISKMVEGRRTASFDEARAAAVAGKRKKAMELLDTILSETPDATEAWILRSHLALGLADKIESLERALEIDPENTTARSAYDFLTSTLSPAKPQPLPTVPPVVETLTQQSHEPVIPRPVNEETNPQVVTEAAGAVFRDDIDHEAPTADTIEIDFTPPAPLPSAAVEGATNASTSPDEDANAVEQVDNIETDITFNHAFDHSDRVEKNVFEWAQAPIEVETPLVDPFQTIAADPVSDSETAAARRSVSGCPFCSYPNDAQAFECVDCKATLTLSDIESLLANPRADRGVIQAAVTNMEAEWNLREFNEQELTALGIGHFNLGSLDAGLKYLQEASRLNPNNVILSGQVNALAIRHDEIRRQNEQAVSTPISRRIMVVDDSPTVRKLIAGKLEKSGHVVECATDGVEALDRLQADELPDLILLDINMPRLDGYEVCKQIRSRPETSELPIVMISGKDGFFDKVRGRMAGATGYVTKPFGPETLMKALDTYLAPATAEPEAE